MARSENADEADDGAGLTGGAHSRDQGRSRGLKMNEQTGGIIVVCAVFAVAHREGQDIPGLKVEERGVGSARLRPDDGVERGVSAIAVDVGRENGRRIYKNMDIS